MYAVAPTPHKDDCCVTVNVTVNVGGESKQSDGSTKYRSKPPPGTRPSWQPPFASGMRTHPIEHPFALATFGGELVAAPPGIAQGPSDPPRSTVRSSAAPAAAISGPGPRRDCGARSSMWRSCRALDSGSLGAKSRHTRQCRHTRERDAHGSSLAVPVALQSYHHIPTSHIYLAHYTAREHHRSHETLPPRASCWNMEAGP